MNAVQSYRDTAMCNTRIGGSTFVNSIFEMTLSPAAIAGLFVVSTLYFATSTCGIDDRL